MHINLKISRGIGFKITSSLDKGPWSCCPNQIFTCWKRVRCPDPWVGTALYFNCIQSPTTTNGTTLESSSRHVSKLSVTWRSWMVFPGCSSHLYHYHLYIVMIQSWCGRKSEENKNFKSYLSKKVLGRVMVLLMKMLYEITCYFIK